MASRPEYARWPTWLAATALSSLGWYLATQLQPLWWAAWLAPIPVLWLATRVSRRRAAAAAFLAAALASFNLWNYYHNTLDVPLAAHMMAMLMQGLYFMLTVLLYRRLSDCKRPVLAMLAVPILWTALAFSNAQLSPNGTWGDLGYSQMNVLLIIQIAALTGVWGIAFLVLLAAAAVVSATNPQLTGLLRFRALTIGTSALVLVLGYGAWRLHSDDTSPRNNVRIGLASVDADASPELNSEKGQVLLHRYISVVNKLAADGATIVVLPEKIWTTSQTVPPALAELAQHRKLDLVVGTTLERGGQKFNMALALAGDGTAPAEYAKHHLVPGWERSFTPGKRYTTLAWNTQIGLAICKDMDFPTVGRTYAKRDVGLLLVPAWDFHADDWLHSRMAILRGVESGFSIARAARDGSLTLSDTRGRIRAQVSGTAGSEISIAGTLSQSPQRTLYARWGNWFGWLNLLGLVLVLPLALRPVK